MMCSDEKKELPKAPPGPTNNTRTVPLGNEPRKRTPDFYPIKKKK